MQRFSRIGLICLVAASAVVTSPRAHAITLFADSFDRANANDIDADTTGITNNTGTVFGSSAVYSSPWIDPANNTTGPDTVATNGGGQRINNNVLEKYNAGTVNMFVNHNFTNASILSAGGFSVSLDVNGISQATFGQGATVAIGMTLAEAQAGHDANDGGTAAGLTPNAKYTNAFQNGVYNAGTVLSDFYFALRADNTLAWGVGGTTNVPAPTAVNVGAKTGTISANFGVTSFNAGSPVTYEVFYNGVSKGTGTFNWSGTNANYIGIDARDSALVQMDNFKVDTVAPPPKPTLVVNRDTGNVTIKNLTSSGLSITSYSIITAQGGFNQANWSKIQSQGIDTNDTWITLTAPTSTTDLAEGTLGEYTIPATTGSINLGNAWRRSPFEDLAFELRNPAGDDIPILVQYTGNGGSPFKVGDFSLNGALDAADWVVLRNHLTSSVSALSQIDRYFAGDLNNDGFVNQTDFHQFKALFTAGNGAGSFEAMLASIPEPAAATLCIVAGVLVGGTLRRRSSLRRVIACGAVVLLALSAGGRAPAADLFVDTFDRPDSLDIDAVTTGITNNTGTTFGPSAVYTSPWVDPATTATAVPPFGAPDADPANGGGQQVLSNQLQLKYQVGTANAFVNHNFTNSAITAAKGFSVSLDLANYTQTASGQGAAIAIGMSHAEAMMGHDALGGVSSVDSTVAKYTNAFQDTAFTGGTVLADFYIALRGNNTVAWGVGTGSGTSAPAPTMTTVAAKTGTITAQFYVNDFNAGSTVGYQVFYNGASQGYGVFKWSGTNENYIGLDGRDSTVMVVDNFKVQTVTGLAPQTLRLQVNTSTGAASILGGGSANALDFYEITSAAGGLIAGNFNGIRGDAGLPAGNGTGNGWELGGTNSANSLTEAYLLGQSTIAANTAAIPLGTIYSTGANTHDVQFTYYTSDNVAHLGFVEYVAAVLPDFNGNGVVDAADYVVWRNNNGLTGGATLSQGDANGDGNVNSADYSLWRASFGLTAGSGSGSLAAAGVPEPSCGVLAFVLLAGASAISRRRRRSASFGGPVRT